MDGSTLRIDPLSELEARQDDVLRRLEELDREVEKALIDCLSEKAASRG